MSKYEVKLKTRVRIHFRNLFFVVKAVSYVLFPRRISASKLIDLSNINEKKYQISSEIFYSDYILPVNEDSNISYRVYELENVTYLNYSETTVIDDRFVVINQHPKFGIHTNKFFNIDFYLNKQFFRRDTITSDFAKVAIIASKNSNNYFHFMFDELTKLLLLLANNKDYLVIGSKRNVPILNEIMEFLNLEIQIYHYEKNNDIRIPNAIMPEYPSNNRFISKWKVDLFNSLFIADKSNSPTELIYITRADSKIRKLSNEKEIFGYLSKIGFSFTILTGMPFSAQFSIFNSAKIIVAPHGAGLTNLLFCSSGSLVIELIPDNKISNPNLFEELCDYKKIEYHYIAGRVVNGLNNDFQIDLIQLKSKLDTLLSRI